MNWVREMNTFDGRQVESGEQGVTLFLVCRDFHDELVPDRFEVIKGLGLRVYRNSPKPVVLFH